MNKVTRKWLIGTGFALLALAATMSFTSCASNSPITITFRTAPTLPNATVGEPYSVNIYANGVTGPPTGTYTYSIVGGSLPAGSGLTFTSINIPGTDNDTKSFAQISGTPTQKRTYTFTVQAEDVLKPPTVATQMFTLTVD